MCLPTHIIDFWDHYLCSFEGNICESQSNRLIISVSSRPSSVGRPLYDSNGPLTLQHNLDEILYVVLGASNVHPCHKSLLVLIAAQVLRWKRVGDAPFLRSLANVESVSRGFYPNDIQVKGSLDKAEECQLCCLRNTVQRSAGLSLFAIVLVEPPIGFLALDAAVPYGVDMS